MKKYYSSFLVFWLLCMMQGLVPLVAQTTPAQARQELQNRNIDEAELRRRLQARGIDIDNASPDELVRIQPQIESVIAEMEAEQAQNLEPITGVSENAETVEESVAEGASLDEAINEVVAEEVAERLPSSNIYGHQLFRNKSLQVYRASDNVRPPATYPLRVGDQVSISIFGVSQADLILEIGEDGFIRPPQMPPIYLKDIPLGQARELLRTRFRARYVFDEGQFSANINASRTISVNIFGEVENNGTFSISSLNTAFNALVAAGGPTDQGTVRNIQLTRDEEVTIIDVYDYLQNPSLTSNLYLSSNDIIYVPRAEKIVRLEGGVERSMRFELIEGENLSELISYGGGLRPRAVPNLIRVTRYTDGNLNVINVDLNEQPDFELQNEDVVSVPIVEEPIENFVTIEGAVLLPGQYSFEPGITIDQLLRKGRLRPEARQDVAFLFRRNDDGTNRLIRLDVTEGSEDLNQRLRRSDRLSVLSQTRFTDQADFSVRGAVRNPQQFPFPEDGSLNLEEAILLAGGMQVNAVDEAIIIRTPLENSNEREYLRISISNDRTLQLQARDQIVVYTQERFTDAPTVSISGSVRESGEYVFSPDLSVRDLFYLAGGLQLSANPNRVEIFRLETDDPEATRTLVQTIQLDENLNPVGNNFELQPFDQVVVRTAAAFEPIRSVSIVGEVRYPGRYALLDGVERIDDLIRRAGGITEDAFAEGANLQRSDDDIGFVVLELEKVLRNSGDPSNMVLRAGDQINIPKRQDLVTIYTRGTLANQFGGDETTQDGTIQVAYQGSHPADWYVKQYAGGFDHIVSRRRWTTVEYANGQVTETGGFLVFKNFPTIKPGATIRVGLAPPQVEKERREERFDWLGLTSIIMGAATTIVTLIIVGRR